MLKISTKKNFYYKHQKLGRLKFRQINLTDLIKIENYKLIGKRYKGFTIFILHNQIVSPKISISDFSDLENREIIIITKYFIKETVIFTKHFKKNEDESFYINFYNSYKSYYKSYQKEISKIFVPIGNLAEQMIKRLSASLTESFSKMAQLNITPKIEFMQKISKEMSEILQKIVIAADNAGRILEKYGWLIPPSMDLRVVSLISNLGNKQGNHRESINKLFLDYYQRDNFKEIELMIKNWESNKLFKKRIRILRDCLKTLKISKKIDTFNSANVIIPTLIAQIDGVLTDYAISKGFDIRKYPEHRVFIKLEEYKEKIIRKNKTAKYDSFVKWDDLFIDMILDTLWGTAFPRKKPKTGYTHTRFYRHKIMHGEYVSYGSIYNVLRAFFLLDFISELE